ncbi:MAG: ferredoxin [Deltaproteobacteria bacterium]|nr:ferredoxin [Deltaproteobacteria bacterium]
MRQAPVIDIRECSDCGTCLELCPSVFRRNDMSGFIEVQELPEYPEDPIQEAIGCCPRDCISWEAEN